MKRELWHARPIHVPDPTLPVDELRRTLTIVAAAIGVVLLIAAVAQLLNPALS